MAGELLKFKSWQAHLKAKFFIYKKETVLLCKAHMDATKNGRVIVIYSRLTRH